MNRSWAMEARGSTDVKHINWPPRRHRSCQCRSSFLRRLSLVSVSPRRAVPKEPHPSSVTFRPTSSSTKHNSTQPQPRYRAHVERLTQARAVKQHLAALSPPAGDELCQSRKRGRKPDTEVHPAEGGATLPNERIVPDTLLERSGGERAAPQDVVICDPVRERRAYVSAGERAATRRKRVNEASAVSAAREEMNNGGWRWRLELEMRGSRSIVPCQTYRAESTS